MLWLAGWAKTCIRGSGYRAAEPLVLQPGIRRVKGSKKLGIRLKQVSVTSDASRTLSGLTRWMRRPVSTGCVTLPMIDVLLSTRKGDRR
jgi:hypothetical protein